MLTSYTIPTPTQEYKGITGLARQITTFGCRQKARHTSLDSNPPFVVLGHSEATYRLNPEKMEILRKEVQSLLDQGLIETSHSPYASPCLLVPKPDGSKRAVIDYYRKLNSKTKADAYPTPRMNDLIDFVGIARFATKLDWLKGHYQIAFHPLAREKTAFVTPDGLHHFTTLTFGLKNAPATFQRMVTLYQICPR